MSDDILAEAQEMVRRLLNEHDAFSGYAADTITGLIARIAAQQEQLRGMALDVLAASGQAQEAYEAQLAAEAALAAMTKERDEHRANWERAFNANAAWLEKCTAQQEALAAERKKTAKLVEAVERWADHDGESGYETVVRDVLRAIAAITEAEQNKPKT